MNPPLPPEALARAQAAVDILRAQLNELFKNLPMDCNGAIRFEPGDPE